MPCYAHPSCLTHFTVDANLGPTALPFLAIISVRVAAALGNRVLVSWNNPGGFSVWGVICSYACDVSLASMKPATTHHIVRISEAPLTFLESVF